MHEIVIGRGDSVRILRELQETSHNDLAAAIGIPQSTISAIENNRIRLGVDRAKTGSQIMTDTVNSVSGDARRPSTASS